MNRTDFQDESTVPSGVPRDRSVVPTLVVVIAGPTASGKSALALALGKALHGVVINADSMQVYRELSILTARPSAAECAEIPHYLYGVLPAADPCSVARWRDMALSKIAEAARAGQVPVVVGGTGLYLRALMRGLAEVPEVPPAVREAAMARLSRSGPGGLHEDLSRRDPEMAARLRPSDSQRLVRAWEVMEATGRSLAAWQRIPAMPPEGITFIPFVLSPPRAELYAACNARFLRMLEAGALEEIRQLDALGLEPRLPAMKALGVPELRRHLHGELGLDAAIAAAQQATRRYAKRQTTWFRHQMPEARRLAASGSVAQFSEKLIPEIRKIIRR